MKILLLGKNGQVGWELQRALGPLGEVIALDRGEADLSELESLAAVVSAAQPSWIVNAAAYTAVDRAEAEPQLAARINAEAPAVLAREAAAIGAWLIHYSTDYVFDGSGDRPWSETDSTGPLCVYGRTKLEGEQVIRASGCKHLILRTSWVYAARGGNFAKTMLKLAAERDELRVVADQVGAPTGAELLADVSAHLIRHAQAQHSGTYHVAAAGHTNWHDYSRRVIAQARDAGRPVRVNDERIAPIATSDYPTPARRPLNSRLATMKLRDTFGLRMPPWQAGVDRVVAEVTAP